VPIWLVLDFNEARDDWMAVASAEQYTNHLHSTPDVCPRQHLITQVLQAGCFFDAQSTLSKH